MLNHILIFNNKKFNKIYTQIILILFFLIGISSVKDYGISYDELEYRQQGFIVLNHIGKKIFPEKIAKIKEERNLDYPTFEKYFGEIKNNFKFQHTLYALVEYIFQKKECHLKYLLTQLQKIMDKYQNKIMYKHQSKSETKNGFYKTDNVTKIVQIFLIE